MMWVTGRLVEDDEARIPAADEGVLSGIGLFETMRIYGTVAFAWDRHMDRFESSAEALEITVPSRRVLESATGAVIEQRGPSKDARLRITVTAGVQSGAGPLPNTIVQVTDLPEMSQAIDTVVVPWPRNERAALVGHKTTSLAESVAATRYAIRAGGQEPVFLNTQEHVCEGARTNLFAVLRGEVFTPALSSGCLPGVTRAMVIEICEQLAIPVHQTPLTLDDLNRADEAFCTSALRHIQPIARVDSTHLDGAKGTNAIFSQPAPLTRHLIETFRELLPSRP